MAGTATIEDAIEIAVAAHRGQKDKAGQPYVLHPLRLMALMRTPSEQMTAVLHDVVEDSNWSLDRLRERGFSDEVVTAVDCLTRRDGELYEAFIERAAAHPLARRVKLADVEDNLDVRRLAELTERDRERLDRYRRAWLRLTRPD
jgi:(p)ppGpp synthase/HD superfamily hydrolase